MRGLFILLVALGVVTALSSLLWRRLAHVARRPAPAGLLVAQPVLGGVLIAAGVIGLLAVR